jgi:hypothetical protein
MNTHTAPRPCVQVRLLTSDAAFSLGWSSLLLCVLLGCSSKKPAAPPLTVSLTAVSTNANGEVLVQLGITNLSRTRILVGVRSAIYRVEGSWTTNFSRSARFVGLAGPGSEASDVSLADGEGIKATLRTLSVPVPFHLEFVCFPSREGVGGVLDAARDKAEAFKDGSTHESYLGESFMVLSPVILP